MDHEDQINKIRAIDDALEPEVLRSPTTVVYKSCDRNLQSPSPQSDPCFPSPSSSSSVPEGQSPEEHAPLPVRRPKRAAANNFKAMMEFFAEESQEKKGALKLVRNWKKRRYRSSKHC